MRGTMMDFPLTLPAVLERAGKLHRRTEIVSRRPDKTVVRSTYGELHRGARRLSAALTRLGMRPGDRVASMMWNHIGHLQAFFGVPCAGGILHTLNLRLHPSEIAGIARHAGDRFLLIDDVLLPILEKFRGEAPFERVIVLPYGGSGGAGTGDLHYEELLAAEGDEFRYPAIDENDGATMCYTSGTTGAPKGVIYSHRSQILHSFSTALEEAYRLSYLDTVLPIAPMFHANAWGLPYAAAIFGARLVLPGPNLEPEGLLDLIEQERVNKFAGIATVLIGIADALEKHPGRWKFQPEMRVLTGGAAAPVDLIRRLDRFGIHLRHSWGLTESSPMATFGYLQPHMLDWPGDKQYEVRARQGFPMPFVEMRISGKDGAEAPWDGATPGEIELRGPWIAASYYNAPEQSERWSPDGWFRTGDIGTMDEDGCLKLVDRAKDLVKSGGEWISSVDMENALMNHPAVKEAAVVGVPHPKWLERPLAAVVLKEGAEASTEELRAFLGKTFAKWQLPDAVVFLAAIPRTSVGKFNKIALREQFAGWKWE
jgi:fatty-acyl-CoA synthase